ncbi:MAG TPA: alanine racemase [Clostridia bacterium]|nr:alanine racemase [Clostridia bacterium]
MRIPIRRTHAVIDLDAIEHNINTLWKRAGQQKGYVVLLKADAYGHGSVAVGRLAEELGAFAGGVAALEEVEYLRSNGVNLPLMMLEDLFADEISPGIERNVKFSVSSLEYAKEVNKVAAKMHTTVPVHVNVDTGMGRLGVQLPRALDFFKELQSLSHLQLEGIFTHFPISDENDKGFSFQQIKLFSDLLRQLKELGIQPEYTHVANSGAVLDFPHESGFQLIRPGVSSFGMYPSRDVDHSVLLQEAFTLQSAFIKVDDFPVNTSIGYGRTFVTTRPSRIGVLPIGYGDGFIRDYSGNADVIVHGMRVPVVGRVSMDMITVDLTDIPEAVKVGDRAVLLGSQQWQGRSERISSEELAKRAGTITYEVTCLIGKRVPRVFLRRGWKIGVDAMSGSFLSWVHG